MTSSKKVSLSEVNQSIDTPNNNRFWQNLKAFLGPGALVAVGYMDPGNWITSVVGGATYKYSLLFVILISSLIAMQLQQMAGKLGIVTQMDLAQATAYPLAQMATIHALGDSGACLNGDGLGRGAWFCHRT